MTIKQNVQKPHWSPEQHNSYNFTSPHYDPIKLPWDHNLKKLKSRLPKDDSTKILTFLANWFSRRFLKFSLTNLTFIVAPPYPLDHNS